MGTAESELGSGLLGSSKDSLELGALAARLATEVGESKRQRGDDDQQTSKERHFQRSWDPRDGGGEGRGGEGGRRGFICRVEGEEEDRPVVAGMVLATIGSSRYASCSGLAPALHLP